MRAKRLCLWVGVALLLSTGAAEAKKPPKIFPLSKVKRGQKGYGLTTMQGRTPERFEFEVIGVTHNFLPKLDIILVKSEDKKLAVTGFWRGMSGSPLFIDGKLTCAFSYGFQFNKVAIGGCTPISYMRREGLRPARHIEEEARPRGKLKASRSRTGRKTIPARVTPQVASEAEWRDLAPDGTLDSALATLGPARESWLLRAPRPPGPQTAPAAGGEDGLVPASVPLALSGFSAPAFEAAKKLMADYPMDPMQAGGTGSAHAGPSSFQLGGPISVQLVRGDMSAAATGTVSYIDGDSVLAFGHPMFQAGEIYAPVAAAEVHTVIPSAFSAFVIASPLRELGTLIQDRKATIMASTGLRTRMIPVHVTVKRGDGKGEDSGRFDVEIMDNRFFSGALANIAALNAVTHYLPDRDRVSARIDSRVVIKDHGSLEYVDFLHSSSGAAGLIGGARGLRALVPLIMNPFAPVEIERVDIEVQASYDTNYGDIESIRLPASELEPGAMSYALVELSTYEGDRWTEKVPFMVPKRLAGSLVRVEVTSGDSTKLDAAPPQSLDDLIGALRKLLPGNTFAVTIYGADEGVAMNGRLIRDLPATALDKLKTSTRTPPGKVYRPLYRTLRKSKRVINGRETVLVKVAELDD